MVIGSAPVYCPECRSYVGTAGRCSSCGWERPRPPLSINLRGRMAIIAVALAAVVLAVVVLAILRGS